MSKYIEREAVLETLLHEMRGTGYQSQVIRAVKSIPVADVELVRHGRWEKVEDSDDECHWMCSSCGCELYFWDGGPVENTSNYCPNCGAKMDMKS